jgi:hypothetical protein
MYHLQHIAFLGEKKFNKRYVCSKILLLNQCRCLVIMRCLHSNLNFILFFSTINTELGNHALGGINMHLSSLD